MTSLSHGERRRDDRITPKGTVTLRCSEYTLHGRVANISRGGMLALGGVSTPERMLGRAVDVEMRLDGMHAQWIHVAARVVRIHVAGSAIAFDAPPASLIRVLDDLMSASRAQQRVLSVVLVDGDALRRTAMARGFEQAGCRVTETTTPLEAIVRLGESSFEPDLIAIADSIPSAVAEELRVFVERDHPRVRLVRIGDELDAPGGIANWLSSSARDLPGRVRHVLTRPRAS